MALLGDLEAVERNLRATPDSKLNTDAAARLEDIQKAVTSYIEERTGRSFGAIGAPESVAIEAPERYSLARGSFGASDLLILPKAIRAITSVVQNPTWTGAGWTGGFTFGPTLYRPAMFTKSGDAMALQLVDAGAWYGRFVITGTWEDTDDDAIVPDDITYVANLLIADLFKYEQSSTASQAGPEGQTLRLRDSTKNPVVCEILDKYQTIEALVI